MQVTGIELYAILEFYSAVHLFDRYCANILCFLLLKGHLFIYAICMYDVYFIHATIMISKTRRAGMGNLWPG